MYRVSAKALILDDNKNFLLVRESKGRELPGGGLEYGETPQECIKRELLEEMGITVKSVNNNPSYFLTTIKENGVWISNIIYETKVDLDDILSFIPSDECLEVKFFDVNQAKQEKLFPNVKVFIENYNKDNH